MYKKIAGLVLHTFYIFLIFFMSANSRDKINKPLTSDIQQAEDSIYILIQQTNKNQVSIGREYIHSGIYPKGSEVSMLSDIEFHFGGIIGNDTLVSEAYRNELYYSFPPIKTSILYDSSAVSESDITTFVVDNLLNPPFTPLLDHVSNKSHTPLNILVTCDSYAWSYGYVEDIIFFNFTIENTGYELIKKFYLGLSMYPIVGYTDGLNAPLIATDDIGGFLKTFQYKNLCNFTDTLNLVWGADNDGDPIDGVFERERIITGLGPAKSCSDVIGILFLNNKQYMNLSYNWWIFSGFPFRSPDWGPRRKENFRNFQTGFTGYPWGNANRYYVMSSGEIDYDQIYTASILPNNPTWLYPDQELANDITDGHSFSGHMLSIGPFDLPPGGTISIPFAYVAGENFHTDPNNIDNLPYFPENYYLNLDFSDIAKNAQWAKWIYDNPGVDTDGDGYFGESMICVLDSVLSDTGWVTTAADTFYYRGDGIPDWKAAGPPPPPKFWVEPLQYGFRIRFNGSLSETEKDIFTKLADFEGYNVYMGRDDRETSLSLVASFDKHNFDKFIYHPELGRYKVEDIPLTLEQLYDLYGENFEPLACSRTSPYSPPMYPDSLFYFKEHSYNASAFGINTPITKVYPEARDPRLIHPDSLTADDYTSDSLFKYFEYELIVEDLLPTVEYFINVTAFDFGSPKSGLQALESSRSINVESGFPLGEHDYQDDKLNVYVYPNPYRIDATYRDEGYEGRGDDSWPDFRVRAINFGNLPPKCTISIYSLDGDLVRRLQHNFPADDPQSHHDHWDLITRNTQMVVSGLYYWVVEADDGQAQMGKLVIIM